MFAQGFEKVAASTGVVKGFKDTAKQVGDWMHKNPLKSTALIGGGIGLGVADQHLRNMSPAYKKRGDDANNHLLHTSHMMHMTGAL